MEYLEYLEKRQMLEGVDVGGRLIILSNQHNQISNIVIIVAIQTIVNYSSATR